MSNPFIAYDDNIGQQIEKLITLGQTLLSFEMIDTDALDPDWTDREAARREGRPIKRLWPDVLGALPVDPQVHGRWFAASLALMASVCGVGHEFPQTFFWLGEGGTRGGVRRGLGVLEGFHDAFKGGTLYYSDKPPNIQEVPRTIKEAH